MPIHIYQCYNGALGSYVSGGYCCMADLRVGLGGEIDFVWAEQKRIVYLNSVSTDGMLQVVLDSVQHWLGFNVIRGLKQRGKRKSWRGSERKKSGQIDGMRAR